MRSPLDVAGMRRRQIKMGLSSFEFRRATGHETRALLDEGTRAIALRSSTPSMSLSSLPAWGAAALSQLRSSDRGGSSRRRLEMLDKILAMDLGAHAGLAFLVAERRDAVLASGRRPRIGIHVEGPHDAELVHAYVGSSTFELIDTCAADQQIGTGRGRAADSVDFALPTSTELQDVPAEGPIPLYGLDHCKWLSWFHSSGRSAGNLH